MMSCSAWMTRVGNIRRSCTLRKSSSCTVPSLSGRQRMFAAATASCTARLMPTPPTGDIACAASPMQRSPVRYQRSSLSTATVRSLISSQLLSASSRPANSGTSRVRFALKAASPTRRSSSSEALAMTNAQPIVAAVEQDHDGAWREASHGVRRVLAFLFDAKPQHVHGGAKIAARQARARANGGVSAVAANHKIGTNFDLAGALRSLRAHAADAAVSSDEISGLGVHVQVKRGIRLCPTREKVQEIPLRHQGNELGFHGQMGEIGKCVLPAAEACAKRGD